MSETPTLILAGLAGGALGAIFFGGLWWTVRRALSSELSALWFFGSLLLRMGIALAGFFYVSRGDWERLVACLVGFVMARVAVTWLTRASKQRVSQLTPEASHAP